MEIGSAAHRMQGLHDCMLPTSGGKGRRSAACPARLHGLASSDGGLGLGHAPSRATGFVAHSAPSSKAKRVLVEALGPYPPHQKPLSLPCCLLSRSRPDRSTKPL